MFYTKNDDPFPDEALVKYKIYGHAALATVVSTWEFSPEPIGTQLVAGEHRMEGSLSCGCVEDDLFIRDGNSLPLFRPKLLDIDVPFHTAAHLGCGGNIKILIEPIGTKYSEYGISEELLLNLKDARAKLLPIAFCVNLKTWERMLVSDEHSPLGSLVTDRLLADSPGMEGDWFISVYNPPLRMIVVGGGEIAPPLMKLAQLAGYKTKVVDPRMAITDDNRFPEDSYYATNPNQIIPDLKPDARTAIIALSQDDHIDANGLLVSLPTDAFYIGYFGPQETYANLCKKLMKVGATKADVARIQLPIGIDIGASTPSEIAIAIMTQVTESLRKPKAKINSSGD